MKRTSKLGLFSATLAASLFMALPASAAEDCPRGALDDRYCDFAITSELSHANLKGQKGTSKEYKQDFKKSKTLYLYEKGSVIINPSPELIDNINQKNLQNIGYNNYTLGEKA
jgi:hypothetical protein